MELEALREFVNPYLTDNIPTEPGLYLFLHNEEISNAETCKYPLVTLVEVRFYKKELIADSDNWETYVSLKRMKDIIGVGRWSTKIKF